MDFENFKRIGNYEILRCLKIHANNVAGYNYLVLNLKAY